MIKIALPAMKSSFGEARCEAARLWNRMVRLHHWLRKHQRPWPSKGDFEKHFKGRFRLHSQTVQALIGKFFANIDTTRTNRANGEHKARYPWRTKRYLSVPWKGQGIHVKGRYISLPMGRGRSPLRLKLPRSLPSGQIVQAELGFYELRLTFKRPAQDAGACEGIAAMDPGVIHLGMITDGQQTLGIVGRGLRSVIQGHNRKKAVLSARLARCTKGSRRWKKLKHALGRSARRRDRFQRNLLHHAANEIVHFCEERQIGTLVAGDITQMNRGKKKKSSRRNNQANGNQPLGQFYTYLGYKLRRIGAVLETQNEAYTSQTCPVCGHRHKPAGRVYHCPRCGFTAPRDSVGAHNQLNKYRHDGVIRPGVYVPSGTVKYLRPVAMRRGVVDPMARGRWPAITLATVPGTSVPQAA